MHGLGAVIGKNITQGRWNLHEQSLHINMLELRAIYFGIVSICKYISNIHSCIRTDSSTAVNYINNQGGSVLPHCQNDSKIKYQNITKNTTLSE